MGGQAGLVQFKWKISLSGLYDGKMKLRDVAGKTMPRGA